MIGRILADLKRRGLLVEAKATKLRPHSRHARPYAVRKPKEYQAERPGALVQIDTMHLTPLPGLERRHFTAVDVVSRSSVVGVRATATAGTARDFLADVLRASRRRVRCPGRWRQRVHGRFEAACAHHGLALCVLPPRSPKRNGHVERANRTHRNEFWELYEGDLELPPLQAALRAWEEAYHHVRPHQALGYLTPVEHLAALGILSGVANVLNENTPLALMGHRLEHIVLPRLWLAHLHRLLLADLGTHHGCRADRTLVGEARLTLCRAIAVVYGATVGRGTGVATEQPASAVVFRSPRLKH